MADKLMEMAKEFKKKRLKHKKVDMLDNAKSKYLQGMKKKKMSMKMEDEENE